MVRYSDELIDEINNNNDIVDVISQYVTLKKKGRNFLGLCPFHKEKTPSFSVSPDKQIFHCFGCGVGGNVIHFISKIENIGFLESLETLAERAGIELPTLNNNEDNRQLELKKQVYAINEKTSNFYHENLYKPKAKEAQDYVKKRKLTNSTLKIFKIGYAGEFNELYLYLKSQGFSDEAILASSLVNKVDNGKFIDRFRKRLMFPICDVRGRTIAFGGRVLDDSKPKYINSPENIVYTKGKHLYGLNIAKESKQEELIIVEGYMDAVSLHQREIPNVVASLGTALTESQGRLLRKYNEKIVIGYDSDGAGQAATIRGLEILKKLGCDVRILQIEGAKDPDEFVIKYGNGRFKLIVDNAISLVEFKIKTIKQKLNLENINDKIKFLNEIAGTLSKVDNQIEKEIYVSKISNEYKISKEAIYAQINKLEYSHNQGKKVLERNIPIHINKVKQESEAISKEVFKLETTFIFLLMNYDIYSKVKEIIKVEDIKDVLNKKIVEKIYLRCESGNKINKNNLDFFEDEDLINRLSETLMQDFDINDENKYIDNILETYKRQKLINKKNELIVKLEESNSDKEETAKIERQLNEIIIALAKRKS